MWIDGDAGSVGYRAAITNYVSENGEVTKAERRGCEQKLRHYDWTLQTSVILSHEFLHWKFSLLEFLTTGNSYYRIFLSSLLQSSALHYIFLYNLYLFKISDRATLSLYFSFFSLQIKSTRSPNSRQKKCGDALLEEIRFNVPTFQVLVTRLAESLFLTFVFISTSSFKATLKYPKIKLRMRNQRSYTYIYLSSAVLVALLMFQKREGLLLFEDTWELESTVSSDLVNEFS